jgi:ATP-dependent DNA ligase
MLAKLTRTLPLGDYTYEPKWDGFRALVFRDGDAVDIRSRQDKKLARYFPEVVEAVRALPGRAIVLDGEIIVPRGPRLDFAALMTRLHPAASRVEQLSRESPASFVAFDVVACGDQDLRGTPFIERRARLVVTPSTNDAVVAASWLAELTSDGIDGVVAKAGTLPYTAGQRTMIKVKRERTADVVVAGFRVLPLRGGGYGVGSLLLGLHDDTGRLVHLGVVSQLTNKVRVELVRELAALVCPLEGHPWEHGFGLEASPLGRLAGSAGRWSPEMVRDWIPTLAVRVCEVTYDTIDERRLRYPARFVRWRPDRDASSCGFDQLASDRDVEARDVGALLRS